jgi:hypothetical protein
MVSTAELITQDFTPSPLEYRTWSVERKLNFIWSRIIASEYEDLPPFQPIDVLGLLFTPLRKKMDDRVDESPAGWRKAIHAHGTVAQVEYVSTGDHPYTGLWQGATGLVRLSVTGDPAKRGFAPGLALKMLVAGQDSANFSALYTLNGQGQDHNFFAHPLSNIVPVVNEFGPQFINGIFRRVTRYPTKLSLQDFGIFDRSGNTISSPNSPEQISLVPELQFASNPHDFRTDLTPIPAETTIFTVMVSESRQVIGHLITKSKFVASAYGDRQLFFRHHRFRDA